MATSKGSQLVDAEDWLEEDRLMLISCWARDGYTYQDIANRIGISSSTFTGWRKRYPEFNEALKQGREIVDYKVENALLKSALGYRTKEVEVITTLRNGKMVEESTRTLTREQPPNVSAIQVWLYNRCQNKWKKNPGEIITDEDDMKIQVTVVNAGAADDKDDESWQQTVNKQIEVRRATEEEVRAKKKTKESDKKNKEDMKTKIELDEFDDAGVDDWDDADDWDDWE